MRRRRPSKVPSALQALPARHQAQLAALEDRAAAALDRAWMRAAPVGDAEMARWLRLAAPALDAAKIAAASSTAAYVAGYARAAGAPIAELAFDARAVAGSIRGGIPTAAILERPVVETRVALSRGASLREALGIGRARAAQYARTDPHLAFREAFRVAASQIEGVVGYRRLPNAGACPLCLTASGQRYRIRDLMPIHPACGCTSAPIIGTHDPGRSIDRQQQEPIAVHEHGELGPVLAPAGEHFAA